MVQRSFCRYVSARINANYQLADRLLNVRIPWAYHQPDHHDRREMQSNFGMAGLDERYLPFVLFAWRGLMYGAIAHSERKRGDLFGAGGTTSSPSGDPRLASYVAAPGRILALREVLAADDMERFDFPNEAWRSLIFDLQDLPPHGYDFSFLKSLPAVDTSPIALLASEREPQDALEYVLDWRATREGRKLMFDWYELLGIGFRGTIVGSTNIQIAKNINVGGDFNQMVVARPR
jgi:hypothetical protein